MPIKFRCEHCQQLMSITRKKAGLLVECPRCQQKTLVPELAAPAVALKQHPETEDSPLSSKPAELPPESLSESPRPPRFHEDDEEEEFALRAIQTDFEEMDLTPMVDVTFLLLIFFMVTASFSIEKSIEVPTPDPDQEGASQTIQPLEELEDMSILVEIDAQNRFYIESETVADPRELPNLLSEVRTRDSKNEVIIKVDERSHHESIVSVIDAAQEIGMQRIRWGVATED